MHFKYFRTPRKVCFVAYGNDCILPPGKASSCLMVLSILEADVWKRLPHEFSYLFRTRQQHPAYQNYRVWTWGLLTCMVFLSAGWPLFIYFLPVLAAVDVRLLPILMTVTSVTAPELWQNAGNPFCTVLFTWCGSSVQRGIFSWTCLISPKQFNHLRYLEISLLEHFFWGNFVLFHSAIGERLH